uniref:Variant Ionotropic Glutamate Receptor n=1 Tax=Panagrellus redivivus TaxID=6233 RepID=A0A7E4V0A3_PANRE
MTLMDTDADCDLDTALTHKIAVKYSIATTGIEDASSMASSIFLGTIAFDNVNVLIQYGAIGGKECFFPEDRAVIEQPRTLYTLLLMLVIIGSALGHGRHLKEKYSTFGSKTSAQLRSKIVDDLYQLKLRSVDFNEYEGRLAKKALAWLAPDREAYAYWDLPLGELIDFIRGYYALTPVKLLEEKRNDFGHFQMDFLRFFNWSI